METTKINASVLLTVVTGWGACSPARRWLASLPETTSIADTLAQLPVEHANGWMEWLNREIRDRLPQPARAEYERVRQSAWAEYERVRQSAWAEYERVRQSAWAEYERVEQPARAEYERVRQPAWAEYERVEQPAWAEYRRALAPAIEIALGYFYQ